MSSDNSGIFNYIDQDKLGNRPTSVPRALAIAASAVIILAGVQAASVLVGPMLLALFLAIILLVPLRWLQNHGCPHFAAFLLVMFFTITMFIGIMYIVAPSMNTFIRQIPAIAKQVGHEYEQFHEQLKKYGFMIGEGQENGQTETEQKTEIPEPTTDGPTVPLPVSAPKPEPTDEAIDFVDTEFLKLETDETVEPEPTSVVIPMLSPEEQSELERKAEETQLSLTSIDFQNAALWLTRIVLYARHLLEGAFLVLIFTIFMLFEATYFPEKVKRAFSKDSPINFEHFQRIADDVRRYLVLKTAANLMSGSAAMAVYYMFGVQGWFFWGIIAFFMYYIPNIGGTLAAIIPGVLILVYGNIYFVALYALCLLAIECTIAYGIEPKLLGHGLRLSTIVIILSLFFWGFLLGPIGLFLAAPLTVMIKIILQAFPETRWLAIFLDAGSREKVQIVGLPNPAPAPKKSV